ncbi:MAG: hypothetical protein AB7V27_10150 [Candidatus Binatia bacterium]
MLLGLGAAGLLIGPLVFRLAPQAQERALEEDEVTPGELQLYIDVYTAMQANHDLVLDDALAQKGVQVAQFRSIERRVQRDDRLVRKVREALIASAKTRNEQPPLVGGSPGTPGPATPSAPVP